MNTKELPCNKTAKNFLQIEEYLNDSKNDLAIREGGRLLEITLKEIYQLIYFSVPNQQRIELQEIERKIGKENKGVHQFSLGEMVRFYIEARLQKKWIKHIGGDSKQFSGVDLGTIVYARNICVHPDTTSKPKTISQTQAELCISILKTFLVASGYIKDSKKNINSNSSLIELWQIKEPNNLLIVTANSSQTSTGKYVRPATGIGQVRALAFIVNSLSQSYNNIGLKNIYLSTDQIQDQFEKDIIILGGPKNNQVARDYLDLLKDFQPANQLKNKIIWRNGLVNTSESIEHFEGIAENNKVRSDYGLIIKSHNIFSKNDNTIFLISGCHTYGTMAAAKFLVDEIPSNCPLEVNSGMNFSILIKCMIRNDYPINMEIEKSFFWERSK